jgi:hypothetical protein
MLPEVYGTRKEEEVPGTVQKEMLNKYIFVHSKDFWTSKYVLDPFTNKDRDSPFIHVIILYWWKQNAKVWKSTKHLLFRPFRVS